MPPGPRPGGRASGSGVCPVKAAATAVNASSSARTRSRLLLLLLLAAVGVASRFGCSVAAVVAPPGRPRPPRAAARGPASAPGRLLAHLEERVGAAGAGASEAAEAVGNGTGPEAPASGAGDQAARVRAKPCHRRQANAAAAHSGAARALLAAAAAPRQRIAHRQRVRGRGAHGGVVGVVGVRVGMRVGVAVCHHHHAARRSVPGIAVKVLRVVLRVAVVGVAVRQRRPVAVRYCCRDAVHRHAVLARMLPVARRVVAPRLLLVLLLLLLGIWLHVVVGGVVGVC